jgi:hypothetical protein
VQRILDKGADIEIKGKDGRTALLRCYLLGPRSGRMATDTMNYSLGTSLGFTQCCRFEGVVLGELDEPEAQAGDALGEPRKRVKQIPGLAVMTSVII